MTDPMITLQNRLYNGLIGSLPGLEAESFQISQPCLPITATDEGLWSYANIIPPLSLTFNRTLLADGFFGSYEAVISQLADPEDELVKVIGEEVNQRWRAHLATLSPQPTPAELPATFRQWAMIHAPSVMNQGASILARKSLFTAALNAIKPYQGPTALPADFKLRYRELLDLVRSSGGASLSVGDGTSANVEESWAGGDHQGLWGLWSQSRRDNRLSRLFAASKVSVEASFQHLWLGVVPPGDWYRSELLHLAHSRPGPPVWLVNAVPSWNDAFGAEGFLLRFLASLVVVDGVDATITSSAIFSEPDRQAIRSHAQRGLWPFYAPTGASVSNSVNFDTTGMTIRFRTEAGNPLVLGGSVLGVARYLGH